VVSRTFGGLIHGSDVVMQVCEWGCLECVSESPSLDVMDQKLIRHCEQRAVQRCSRRRLWILVGAA